MLNSDLVDKEILQEQIMRSRVIGECVCGCKSINIQVGSCSQSRPYSERIPIEMTAFESGKAPIMFLLHVVNEYINELNLFTRALLKPRLKLPL